MSAFGLFHTVVSLAAVALGGYALARRGRIDPRSTLGQWYVATTFVGSATAFGIFRHGHFTIGHALSVVTLVLLSVGLLGAWRQRWFRDAAKYVETFGFSATYLFLWIFTATETLTRVPHGAPLATGPTDPVLVAVHSSMLAAFALGYAWQAWRLYGAGNKALPRKVTVA